METVIEEWLMKKYEGVICRITRERKEDLQMPNHLMGHRRLFLQLHFQNVSDLLTVRRDIMPLALANSAKLDAVDAYAEVVNATSAAATNIELEGEWDGVALGERWGRTRGEGGWGRKEGAEVDGALVPARERLMFMFMFITVTNATTLFSIVLCLLQIRGLDYARSLVVLSHVIQIAVLGARTRTLKFRVDIDIDVLVCALVCVSVRIGF